MKTAFHYDVHLPPGRLEGQRYPVIFTLHGKGSNERNLFGLVEPLTDAFIVIGIRGNRLLGNGFQYYDLKSLGNPIREQFDQAMAELTAFIRYATETYPVDPKRRYVLGFSQGAILAMSLALTMGDELKGIVALNGYVPGFVKTEYPLRSVANVSAFISHGEFDGVFPVAIGRENADYFGGLTERLTFKTYPADHGVTPENQRDFAAWLRADAERTTTTEGADVR
ncbi:dienelactone hydrolase family protein [Paenibacillus sp. MWE-103]|uniref:Dienelactone hydrolase family protein n=1 Tax=Paenibacillus artemisiicola TaxID=1172618 RepID=A0ABS3WI67_9BACL|nr:alpha/beta hydrolase-fold protein [Paenibacillus artemisiicola]MBO7747982.1 dienelactone hydrolase family protein [Paenibacillus artemisiicola]